MPSGLKLDPTRTTMLRRQYSVDMARRFRNIRRAVVKVIADLDVLGLIKKEPMSFNVGALPQRQAWRFRTDAEKVDGFNKWFKEQVDADILTVDVKGDPWTAKYVGSAYKKGSLRAYTDMHKEELADTPDFYAGSREQFLLSSFNHPERISKLRFLYTRSYEDLKGISAAMSQQVSRQLANGIAQGLHPRTIARNMANAIAGITKKRALVMARTEVIAAHAEGQLDSYQELGVDELRPMAEWSTAGDDRVCPLCEVLDSTVMTVDEARGLIPRHANCRCSWIPANVGEKDRGKFWSKIQKERRVKKSMLAELPKRTRAGDLVPQTTRVARGRSRWAGKDVKFGEPPTGPILPPVAKVPFPPTPKSGPLYGQTPKAIEPLLMDSGIPKYTEVGWPKGKGLSVQNRELIKDSTAQCLDRKALRETLGKKYTDVCDDFVVYNKDNIVDEWAKLGGTNRSHIGGYYDESAQEVHLVTGARINTAKHGSLQSGQFGMDVSYSGLVRHELGHGVHRALRQWKPLEAQQWAMIVDDIGLSKIKKSVSTYGGSNFKEAFAEAFSAYTHPDYKHGFLPKRIESFMDKFVGAKVETAAVKRAVAKRLAAQKAAQKVAQEAVDVAEKAAKIARDKKWEEGVLATKDAFKKGVAERKAAKEVMKKAAKVEKVVMPAPLPPVAKKVVIKTPQQKLDEFREGLRKKYGRGNVKVSITREERIKASQLFIDTVVAPSTKAVVPPVVKPKLKPVVKSKPKPKTKLKPKPVPKPTSLPKSVVKSKPKPKSVSKRKLPVSEVDALSGTTPKEIKPMLKGSGIRSYKEKGWAKGSGLKQDVREAIQSSSKQALNRKALKKQLGKNHRKICVNVKVHNKDDIVKEWRMWGPSGDRNKHAPKINGFFNEIMKEVEIVGQGRTTNLYGKLQQFEWRVDASYTGLVRHELGHAAHMGLREYVPSVALKWEGVVKKVGLDNIGTSVSRYAKTNAKEAFAESFSAYTHPSYKRGFLPKRIESFMDEFVGPSS